MSLVRVGLSDKKFAEGYEAIFRGGSAKKPVPKVKKPKKKSKKK